MLVVAVSALLVAAPAVAQPASLTHGRGAEPADMAMVAVRADSASPGDASLITAQARLRASHAPLDWIELGMDMPASFSRLERANAVSGGAGLAPLGAWVGTGLRRGPAALGIRLLGQLSPRALGAEGLAHGGVDRAWSAHAGLSWQQPGVVSVRGHMHGGTLLRRHAIGALGGGLEADLHHILRNPFPTLGTYVSHVEGHAPELQPFLGAGLTWGRLTVRAAVSVSLLAGPDGLDAGMFLSTVLR